MSQFIERIVSKRVSWAYAWMAIPRNVPQQFWEWYQFSFFVGCRFAMASEPPLLGENCTLKNSSTVHETQSH
jgi:hypothetical protein